jgi:hypothetical protein
MALTTLEQRISAGIARGNLWFNEDPLEVRLCCFCGESLLIDYFQLGIVPMNRELASFIAAHKGCSPREQPVHTVSISPARLERGMRRLLSCLSHGDDQTCDMCRGNAV